MTTEQIMSDLRSAVDSSNEWAELGSRFADDAVGIHLAIFVEPFLSLVLSGKKTIESRFSKHAIAPYNRVLVGDLVFLKAGPVVGYFTVSSVDCKTLQNKKELDLIRMTYSNAICAESSDFWRQRIGKHYVTLLGVEMATQLPRVRVSKVDKRGWVVLRQSPQSGEKQDSQL
ncbi:hypothetical protein AXFE_09070 [Acidithrix ferrooxidans]|uniref:ASCH domain-containing protein n=2 Tax=Acidithrix ferrooxidans TaxID=1280514 RepID=A0A0D8HK76_9ACTN|nr:hypothetical protein AXFE_09070 [Acidithrix ferrooxidans]